MLAVAPALIYTPTPNIGVRGERPARAMTAFTIVSGLAFLSGETSVSSWEDVA
jgi:hypothetical protein